MFGYIPLGMAFWVLFQSLGYMLVFAPLAGVVIYGSAQFLAVSLWQLVFLVKEAFIATLLTFASYVLWAFGNGSLPSTRTLTVVPHFGRDETYSLITAGTPVSW